MLHVLIMFYILTVFLLLGAQTGSAGSRRKPAGEHEFPMIAEIYSNTRLIQFCAGAIITKRHIITAAHCLTLVKRVDTVSISVGSSYSFALRNATNMTKYDIHKFELHPDYRDDGFTSDLAVIQVYGQLTLSKYINRVCLVKGIPIIRNRVLTTAGWGQVSETDSKSLKYLSKIHVDVHDFKRCSDYFDGEKDAPLKVICAFRIGRGTCLGNSGGPVLYVHNRRHVLAGIVSAGGPSCANSPSFNVRISYYVNWIIDTVKYLDPKMKVCVK